MNKNIRSFRKTSAKPTEEPDVLHYYHNGSGEPVVFIHGMYASHHYMSYLYELMPDKHIIAPDLLGFGSSPKPREVDYSAETQTQFILDILKELTVTEPVTLVGHSMGGIVSLFLARELGPDKVRNIYAVNTPIHESAESLRKQLSGNAENPEEVLFGRKVRIVVESNPIMSPIAQVIARPMSKYWHRSYPQGTFADALKWNWTSYVGSFKGALERQEEAHKIIDKMSDKITFISGEDDPFRSVETEAQLAEKYSGLNVHTLPGGHHAPVEQPEAVLQYIT